MINLSPFILALVLTSNNPPQPPSINSRTLNLYYAAEPLALPCFMPIEVKVSYNSYSADTSIFGKQWTFEYNVIVKDEGDHLEVVEGDGFATKYTKEKNLEEAKIALVEALLIAQKKEDVKKGGLKDSASYESLKNEWLKSQTLRDQAAKRLVVGPMQSMPGIYYSFARGRSTLEKKPNGEFVRQLPSGSKEFFNKSGQITKRVNRLGHYLDFAYDQGRLFRINDSCGRNVGFFYQKEKIWDGLVSEIKDSLGRSIKYKYNELKYPIEFISSNRGTTSIRYDKHGNITSLQYSKFPDKNIEFTYSEKLEVAVQKGPGEALKKFKRTFVGNDPNHSITEISSFKIVTDKKKKQIETLAGREVHENKVKEFKLVTKFDAYGKEIEREKTTYSPKTGFPSSILDGRGMGFLYDYNPDNGNLLRSEEVPAGVIQELKYSEQCPEMVANMKTTQPDKSKKTPVIKNTVYQYDARCNVVRIDEKTGDRLTAQITLEYFVENGKMKFLRDSISKSEFAFTYWAYGKPESITLKDQGTLLVKYSADGDHMEKKVFPNGKAKETFKKSKPEEIETTILSAIQGNLSYLINFLKPAGLNIGN